MSNAGLKGSSESNKGNLRKIFDTMAYDLSGSGVGNLASIKKWLVDDQKSVLSSKINSNPVGSDSDGHIVPMTELSELLGTDVKARLLNKDVAVLDAYKRLYKPEEATMVLNSDEKDDRKSKFQDLIKNATKDLGQLEAYAVGIPVGAVQKYEEPKWMESLNSPFMMEIRKQLEAWNTQILLRLSLDTYSLAKVIGVLSAAVQIDGPLLFLISPNNDSDARQLLPVLYLIDLINKSRIRNRPIDVLLLTSDLVSSDMLRKLVPIDESLKQNKCKAVIEMGSSVTKSLVATTMKTAALNLSNCNGSSVHYVIESSADISSAISSMARNTWCGGVEINHRCRPLAFIHQPVYAQVVNELKNLVEKIKVNSWDSTDWTNCDFVSRQIDASSGTLSSVDKLGAKILATKGDYSVPTVIYDIGTSSDLVAVKERGLGHILCLIPYRSLNELFSLANNFGIPDQVFLYSNCITTSMNILRKLNASEILVNPDSPPQSSPLSLSWKVVSKFEATTKGKSSNPSVPATKPETNASKWNKLSNSSKIQKLNELIKANGLNPGILLELLSQYLDITRGSSLCTPCGVNTSASGIIVADAAGISISNLMTSLIACVLREKPVVVVSIGTELPSNIVKSVKDHLPSGLVSFLVVENTKDIVSLIRSWELVWALQGTETVIALDFLSNSSETRILLVNNPEDKDFEFNARVAIASAFKKCCI